MEDGCASDVEQLHYAEPWERTPEWFPELGTISAAFFFQCLPRPTTLGPPPEYVEVTCEADDHRTFLGLAQWNVAWESGVLRHDCLLRRLPKRLRRIGRYPEVDFRLVPMGTGRSCYPKYAPLYHLLPLGTLSRFGLPALKRGIWPTIDNGWRDGLQAVPDADIRLSRAVAYHLWPFLSPGRGPSAFARKEPIVLLAHALDFWLPYIDQVAQARMRALGPVEIDDENQRTVIQRLQLDVPPDVEVSRPLFGGAAWRGEAEALEATRELVERADAEGHLRAILDTIRSHRVEEDFSSRWSFAREDFERRLYRKRNRIQVSFLELPGTIPTHGPASEAEEGLLWRDFMGLVNPKDRRVVVLLRRGITRASDLARELGYANHSPVSKALARIRCLAQQYFSEN